MLTFCGLENRKKVLSQFRFVSFFYLKSNLRRVFI